MSAGPGPTAVRRAAALVALVVAALATLALPTPAQAAETPVLAAITITSFEPALPKADDTITITGRVTNTSKERIDRPQVVFWRNQAPITDTDGLDTALGSAAADPVGNRYPQSFQNIFDTSTPYLSPGKSASFSVSAKVADLSLAPTDGVFLMGVQLLNPSPPAVARSRVLVPVLNSDPDRTSTVTSLVVMTSRPAQISTGLFADDHLASELAATGRLGELLTAALADTSASYAVDPALIAEVQAMRAGYQVRTEEGGTTAGTGQAAATRWLADFAKLSAAHDGYRLLYGSPDVAALAHARQTDVLRAADTAGRAVALTAALPLLVLPTNGAADEETVQAAEQLHPRAVLIADSGTGGAGPLLAGAQGGAPLLTYASTALGGGPSPDPSDDAVHIRQRALASSWIDVTTAAEPGAQIRLISTAAQAASTKNRDDPPWVVPAPLSSVLARTPASWSGELRYPSSASDDELSPGQLATLQRFADSQQTWQDLLVDGTAAEQAGDAALARAASGAWRGHNAQRTAFLGPQQDTLDGLLTDKIRITSTRKVSTVGQQGVKFPITIRNTLPVVGPSGEAVDPNAVRVRLAFASDNRSRLQIKTIDADSIPPDEGFTADAEVTARANGTVPVVAQLYTMSGRKVGEPVEIEVRVTQNGTTGWAIALVSLVVLAGSTSWRIRQVSRERARQAALVEAASEPVSALTSAPPADVEPRHEDLSTRGS